ncbi:hypothetical protein TNCT1_19870 [Streptomyces sp. 1-11]|nr:hypothetical protein TNCT1_19870 [Streptomyces sp. 1-11]
MAVPPALAVGGAAAPTETTAAETARTASFRVPGRPIRTSRRDKSAQRNEIASVPTVRLGQPPHERHTSNTGT